MFSHIQSTVPKHEPANQTILFSIPLLLIMVFSFVCFQCTTEPPSPNIELFLETPAHNAVITETNTPTFIWRVDPNAKGYKLYLDNRLAADGMTNQHTPEQPLEAQITHEWYVTAFNDIGSVSSTVREFTIDYEKPDDIRELRIPTLSTPEEGTSYCYGNPVLTWAGIDYFPQTYDIEIAKDTAFSIPIRTYTDIGALRYEIYPPLAPGTYYWHARVKTDLGTGEFSAAQSFSITSDLTPFSNVTVGITTGSQSPILVWDGGYGCDHYEISLSTDAGMTTLLDGFPVQVERSPYQVEHLMPGKYYWQVEAIHTDCTMSSGVQGPFGVNIAGSITLNEVILVDNPYFSWTDTEQGSLYSFVLASDSSFSEGSIVYEAESIPNPYTYTEGGLEFDTQYYYKIQPYIEDCYGEASMSSFYYNKGNAILLDAVVLPSCGSAILPSFSWTGGTGATSYDIYVSPDSSFGYWLQGYPQHVSAPPFTPTMELVAGTYYWKVVAHFANGTKSSDIAPVEDDLGNTPADLANTVSDFGAGCGDMPTFTWSGGGNDTYNFQINGVTDTAYNYSKADVQPPYYYDGSALTIGDDYAWVIEVNQGGCTYTTPVQNFTAGDYQNSGGSPDAYEMDNVIPRPVTLDGPTECHTLHDSGDVDWFELTVPAFTHFQIEMKVATFSDNQGLDRNGIGLYDTNFNALSFAPGSGDCCGPRDLYLTHYTSSLEETYFVYIYSNETHHTIDRYQISFFSLPQDPYEFDNDLDHATEIQMNPADEITPVSYTHTLSSRSDNDYYRFQVPAETHFTVEMYSNGGALDRNGIALYNESRQYISQSGGVCCGIANRSICYYSVEGGWFYVRAWAPEQSYTNHIDIEYTIKVTENEQDAYEMNETFAMASEISYGEETMDLEISCGDEDWFKVLVPAEEQFVFQMKPNPNFRNGIYLYDEEGHYLMGRDSCCGPNNQLMGWINLETEPVWYYIKANYIGNGSLPAPYTLYIGPGNMDAFEYDNEMLFATEYAIGDLQQQHTIHYQGNGGGTGDQDFFKVSVVSGTTYEISLTNVGSGLRVETWVYDTLGVFTGDNCQSNSNGADLLCDFTPTQTGDYYINVAGTDRNYGASAPDGTANGYIIRICEDPCS